MTLIIRPEVGRMLKSGTSRQNYKKSENPSVFKIPVSNWASFSVSWGLVGANYFEECAWYQLVTCDCKGCVDP
jgi:hypothetical protein